MTDEAIEVSISASRFMETTDSIHHAGIKQFGKSYKQRSHTALISAFFKLIDQQCVSTLLEIGAFQAEISRRFVAEAPARQALAVEANPYNYKKFKQSLNDAGVLYHHAAVLNRDGPCDLQLHTTEIDSQNGYIRGNNSLLTSDARPETRNETIPGITLDSLVAEYVATHAFHEPSVKHPALWIDVEGALDLVIKGGSHTLKDSLMVFAEVETQRLWNNQAIFPEIASLMNELGFFPYLRDCEYEPEQFNVIFANRELINQAVFQQVATEFYQSLEQAS